MKPILIAGACLLLLFSWLYYKQERQLQQIQTALARIERQLQEKTGRLEQSLTVISDSLKEFRNYNISVTGKKPKIWIQK